LEGCGIRGSWKTVKFIAKFEDYADALHPFMFHCHIALHEDDGMMGQFVVEGPNGTKSIEKSGVNVTVFPNPSHDKLYLKFEDEKQSAYYVTIFDAVGRAILMLPKPELQGGIDISKFSKGNYSIVITENKTKQTISKMFIVD
jgi:hypothetical protein